MIHSFSLKTGCINSLTDDAKIMLMIVRSQRFLEIFRIIVVVKLQDFEVFMCKTALIFHLIFHLFCISGLFEYIAWNINQIFVLLRKV